MIDGMCYPTPSRHSVLAAYMSRHTHSMVCVVPYLDSRVKTTLIWGIAYPRPCEELNRLKLHCKTAGCFTSVTLIGPTMEVCGSGRGLACVRGVE